MRILGVIPARFGSTRFPGKPLAMIHGQSMIERVYRRSELAAHLTDIVVATDDARIAEHVHSFGKAVLTFPEHPSGTDRVGQVAELMPDYDVYINIQGDEPMIQCAQIDAIAQLFIQHPKDCAIATLVKAIHTATELFDPKEAKVVFDKSGFCLYFSRSPIPHAFKVADETQWPIVHRYYKHIGIYGFQRQALLDICKLPPSQYELIESLEQLRWLEHGYRIRASETTIETYCVDTPNDLEWVIENWIES